MQPGEALAVLLSAEGRRDPYPLYTALRGYGPVLPAGDGFIAVTGYDEVSELLRDQRLSSRDDELLDQQWPQWRDNRAVLVIATSMLRTDPPAHTRMRRLAGAAFTARRVAAQRDVIGALAGEFADELATDLATAGGTADFMAAFAYPLPVAVICALLGVPPADRSWFRRRAADLTAVLELLIDEAEAARADRAARELEAYFAELIEQRRGAPGDDLISALVQVHDADGDRLTAEELLANLVLLLVAGFETTTNLLGNGLVTLLDHPEQAALLRAEPERATAVVQELLRFDSPVQLTTRLTREPIEVAGVPVPAGAQLLLLLGAANRDPRRFTEPDRFDPGRAANQPLSFGAGGHYCLGAPLARLEAQVAFPLLLRRFPGLAIAGGARRRDRLTLRGYATLPVHT